VVSWKKHHLPYLEKRRAFPPFDYHTQLFPSGSVENISFSLFKQSLKEKNLELL
jgi:hypothetical protein